MCPPWSPPWQTVVTTGNAYLYAFLKVEMAGKKQLLAVSRM
jgi:hypothetical protein